MAEAMKLAYADRSEYLGDPDFVKIPLKGLTSKRYADELAKASTPQARSARTSSPASPSRMKATRPPTTRWWTRPATPWP
jgi:gamma-glutamyltranspeptidase/glutathione hydrolase